MKKTFLPIVTVLAILLSLTGCEVRYPKIENTFSNAISYGNTLAAEQGDYLAMRGGVEETPTLFLYHKTSQKSYPIVAADIYQIGLLDNTVFYKNVNNDCLYSYNLETKEHKILIEHAMNYQVRDGVVYYLTEEHGNYLSTYDIASGTSDQLETGNVVDAFWLTDYGMYYCDDEKNVLMVLPWGEKVDRIVAIEEGMIYRDVYGISGSDCVYLKINNETAEATICHYKASQNKATEYITGYFDNFIYTRDHAVTEQDGTVYAVNPAEGKTYTWGTVDTEYDYIQFMSDCMIFYNDDDTAMSAIIQYYPTEE
ncbi:MAG: DUF5050 domain-containing protein [Clostridia bacterium]|nr:DUF5050 domain-containing protein [Clostridia bacterium]